jgi:hypothetical protein
MKKIILTLIACSTLSFASLIARADDHSCATYIQQSVVSQAEKDFPGQNLVPVMPTIYEDGGSVESYQIPMINPKNPLKSVVTYDIQVGETCDIMHLYQL